MIWALKLIEAPSEDQGTTEWVGAYVHLGRRRSLCFVPDQRQVTFIA
jgi:hypothetical protein